ncbi:PREDICTED: glutamate-rich protein 3-like, partial [Galeopterus variegatus]|uniref:Glutamate-rich protein 3-like n=1 Tax=Galeopterus variegatus TaxID=482537 RepID=A0ABM0Q516_GALVR
DDEAPDEWALMQTGFETKKAASEWGRSPEKAVLANKAAALHSEHLWEAAALREAVTPENGEAGSRAAVSAAVATQPDMDGRGQEAATDLEDREPVEDAASQTEDGSGEAMVGGEKPSRERKEVMGTETPWSSSTGETGAARAGESEGRPEELCKDDVQRQDRVTEADPNREHDRRAMSPEELDGARERRAERPVAPLRETEPEREEVTRADAPKDEDVLEEEPTLKGEEGETVKEGRSEEETKAPHSEIGSGAEDEVPAEASELTEDTGFPENSLTERVVSMFEARPGSEESLEKLTTLRKDGEGERLIAARDMEHRGRAELLAREDVAPSKQELGPPCHGGGASGAPASQLAGKAQTPEVTTTATGEAEECAAEDPDCLAGLQGREEEGPLQGQEGAGDKLMIQEDVPEGEPMMAGKSNEGGKDKDPEEEEDEECALGTGEMKDRNTEGDGDMGGGAVMAEEGLQGGGKADTAAEKREVWADSKTAE